VEQSIVYELTSYREEVAMGETCCSPRVLVVEDEPTIALGSKVFLVTLALTKSISRTIY